MAPHNQSRLHAKRSEEAEDEISYDKSLDSLDMSIDSQDQEVKNEANLSSSIQNGISEGLSRFFAQWRILLLGQFLSILLACSGAISASMHFNCNISAPTMQTAMVFFLMSFHALPLLRRNTRRRDSNDSDAEEHNNTDDTTGTTNPNPTMQNGLDLGGSVSIDSTDIFQSNSMKTFNNNNPDEAQKPHSTCCGILPLTVPWWAYAAFACILVEASFFTFLALRYTTLPSAALLDNTNILAAMIGSRLILNRRYSATHIFGAMICCVGVFLNITSDWKKAGEDVTTIDDDLERIEIEEYPKRLLGDCIAIIGGLLVGLCDVVIELVVKDFVSVNEYLGCVGIFGTVIASVQAFALERMQIVKIFAAESGDLMTTQEIYELYADDPFNAPRSCRQGTAIGLVVGYAVSAYLFNYCMTRFLAKSESALLTLSLLTADLYSVIFTVVAEHIPPSILFYFSFILVIVGVIVYEMAPSPLGIAEDLVINKGIVIEREKLQEMNNLSLSWNSSQDLTGDQCNKDIEQREIL